ncbi:2-polyprenyl-6-methoxyphenol hydroxylase-like FAD-dependent oxidoreductase [Kineococcus radiotolerans]|uniref:2-polyprenyl-6-methoxyphenol hydroxylase-like FAD-dependent oxidoreductase n=1 Tax=Kineococcus radiotolerans TaxID=131568 RepID=A0A7W4XZF0_KINRA|nr:FAD-dependent monooxygenase [Kineococcus radiotolerans]MBB2903285.1 2-polyprenyl-6-methoxyphenol hydroxylase-like FAD-dependent oxidoreductase [Kineococcus radiotolerans]
MDTISPTHDASTHETVTAPPPLRVVVIGGGIGGLALAAGLRRAGFDVVVHDRDLDPAVTGGYHITLDTPAQNALRALLEPSLFAELLASASAVRRRPPDVWFDWRGRLLGELEVEGLDPDSIDIDRISLRLLLAEAVGGDLVLGSTCTAVQRDPGPGGRVRASFADGSTAHGDLLVGADGPHSLVVRHLAGHLTSRPAGLIGISGRTSMADLDPADAARLGPRSSLTVGPRGTALYTGYLDPDGFAVLDAAHARAAITTGPTYVWGAMFPDSTAPEGLRGQRGSRLRETTIEALRAAGWGEPPLHVIARTSVGSMAAYRFNVGPEHARDMAPWPAGAITALGDAVHATPPTAGKGAGTAIIDAHRLVEELTTVRAGTQTLHAAVSTFEADMRHRGSAVIALSMTTVNRILASSTPVGSAITRASLPFMAWSAGLKRKLAHGSTRADGIR